MGGAGAGRTPVVVFGDREGFGDEAGDLLEPKEIAWDALLV